MIFVNEFSSHYYIGFTKTLWLQGLISCQGLGKMGFIVTTSSSHFQSELGMRCGGGGVILVGRFLGSWVNTSLSVAQEVSAC